VVTDDNGTVTVGVRPRVRGIERGGLAAGLCAALATTAAVFVVLLVTRADPPTLFERTVPPVVQEIALLGTFALLVAAWASQLHRHRASIGLSVVAVSSLVPGVASLSTLPDGVRAGVLAAAPMAVAGAAEVALGWTIHGRRARTGPTVWMLAVAAAIVHLAGYNPLADPGCHWVCVSVEPVAEGLLDTREAVAVSSALSVAGVLIAIVSVVRARSRVPRPIGIGALAALVLLGAVQLDRWASWRDPAPSMAVPTMVTASAALLLAVPVVAATVRTSQVRRAVDDLVAVVSGPGLVVSRGPWTSAGAVHFAIPGDGRWVDVAGREVHTRAGEAERFCELRDEAGPVVRLPMAGRAAGGDVMSALTPATLLALRNTQLAAVAKARVADVQASQRRVVAASDAERRRIERDLHDGAQQRLVSASIHLSLARNRLPAHEPALARAESAVTDALANLRAIAHGIFPAVLADEGLEAALEDVVAVADVPTKLIINDTGGAPADVAMAVYAAVVATIDWATAAGAFGTQVSVSRRTGSVLAEIDSEFAGEVAPPPELVEVADRIGALGGALSRSSGAGRMIVAAEIPCGS
jgi:signal transduction histidine kinase